MNVSNLIEALNWSFAFNHFNELIELHPKFSSNCHVSVSLFFVPASSHPSSNCFIHIQKRFYTYLCVLFYNNSTRIFRLLFIVVWNLPFIICICTCSSSCTFFEFLTNFKLFFFDFCCHMFIEYRSFYRWQANQLKQIVVVSFETWCGFHLLHIHSFMSSLFKLIWFYLILKFVFFSSIKSHIHTHHSSQFHYHKIFNPNSNVVVDFASLTILHLITNQ